jgi:ribonuclease VapC
VESRKGPAAARKLDEFLETGGIRIVEFGAFHARLALEAWRRFGKGRHPAALNFGDCCTYALCRATGEPLLAKGEDFSRTDVKLVRV